MRGLIFAIEEMAVHDGPGLRACIFLKGCPLRCQWCHNPEGWEMRPQRVKSPNGCLDCGRCRLPCESVCRGCGGCLYRCPRGLLRISGKWWTADALAARMHRQDAILSGGGVTISGGEPLMQPEFLRELLMKLAPLHRCIETSGYASREAFESILPHLEMAYFDLKIMDEARHRQYTGASNEPILANLEILKRSGVPFTIRIPTMANVNDSAENMTAVAEALVGAKALQKVEILPYNLCAGAKYPLLGLTNEHVFRQPSPESLNRAQDIFRRYDIPLAIRS